MTEGDILIMRISFTCRTNKPYTMINALKLRLKNGTSITVDRKESNITNEPAEDGLGRDLTMEWRSCYLWAINDYNIFGEEGLYLNDPYSIDEFRKLVKEANVWFELEDDAPDEDYDVRILNLSIS